MTSMGACFSITISAALLPKGSHTGSGSGAPVTPPVNLTYADVSHFQILSPVLPPCNDISVWLSDSDFVVRWIAGHHSGWDGWSNLVNLPSTFHIHDGSSVRSVPLSIAFKIYHYPFLYPQDTLAALLGTVIHAVDSQSHPASVHRCQVPASPRRRSETDRRHQKRIPLISAFSSQFF